MLFQVQLHHEAVGEGQPWFMNKIQELHLEAWDGEVISYYFLNRNVLLLFVIR